MDLQLLAVSAHGLMTSRLISRAALVSMWYSLHHKSKPHCKANQATTKQPEPSNSIRAIDWHYLSIPATRDGPTDNNFKPEQKFVNFYV